MKNKLIQLRERLFASSFYRRSPRPVRWIIGSLSNNLGYKLLSLLLAILLWNYVIATNSSITRNKTIYNLTGTVSGLSTLSDNKLALSESPEEALSGITVTVEAPQADYSRVSADPACAPSAPRRCPCGPRPAMAACAASAPRR